MPWICKWCYKFFVIRLQVIPEFIIICISCPKIFAIIQNGSLSFIKIVKLYPFYFLLVEMEMEIIKLKTQYCFIAASLCRFLPHQIK